MQLMRITLVLGLALSAAFTAFGYAMAQERVALTPAGGWPEGRFTKAELDKDEATPGATVKLVAELEILGWAPVSSLGHDPNRVEHRGGHPPEQKGRVRFVLYQDGKPIAGQDLAGPYIQGKVLTHTFEARVPEKPGRFCFEVVAVRSGQPDSRVDSRRACLMIQEATGLADARRAGWRDPADQEANDRGRVRGMPLPGVLDPSRMTAQQFEGLSPDARLQVRDRVLTKAELSRVADEELHKSDAWHKSQDTKIHSDLAALQTKLDQERKVQIAAADADVMTKLKTGPDLSHLVGKLMDIPCITPQITGFLVGSKVTPGGTIVMFGCGFTGNPEMRLNGKFPGGFVKLTPTLWEPDVFAGVIPSGLNAIPHTGSLQVFTTHGASNPWPAEFIPAEEVRVLSEVQTDCSDSAYTKDLCPKTPCSGSLCATHTNYAFWADYGKDRVEAAGELGYGWTYYMMGLNKSSNNGDATVEYNGNPTRPKLTVSWSAGAFGSIAYNAKILIRGPRGIPHFQGMILDRPLPPPPSPWEKKPAPNP